MNYDFDTVYDRRNTNTVKYKKHPRYPSRSDLIPLWVADMDFKTAPEILQAIESVVAHGIFGYTEPDDAYFRSIMLWYKKRFGVNLEQEWLVPCDSVMSGIATAIRAFTKKKDAVLIFQPVYYPFSNVIVQNERRVIVSELASDGIKYTIDFNDFESKIIRHLVKSLLFCSPHNPVGRVWDEEELIHVADICAKHGVMIISDEIHADLVFKRHVPFTAVAGNASVNIVILTSFTKTFNLAGIQGAHFIIPDPELRAELKKVLCAQFSGGLNTVSVAAATAAYQHGEEWLTALLAYLKENIYYVVNSFQNTKIKAFLPEGTYLMWLDCRALGLSDDELEAFFVEDCGVWLNSGCIFGNGGSGFMRMNIACPRATLEKAVDRILRKIE